MCDSGGCVLCVTVEGVYCVKTAPITGPVCENNGTCESGRCLCPSGYGGYRCEQSTYVHIVLYSYIMYVLYCTVCLYIHRYCMYVCMCAVLYELLYAGVDCMCVYVLYCIYVCI